VPVVADEHADPELGSGAVKITPGHDFNDFEVGKRAGFAPAEMLNMLDADAAVCQTADGLIPEKYRGKDRFEARDMVVAELKELGCLIPHVTKNKDGEEEAHDAEPRTIQTPYGDRGGVVIEPWLTDQWYVDAEKLAVGPMAAVRDGRIEIVPKSWEKTFFNWMENIQPWCVSRQLWWGHRIPAWYDEDGNVFVAETLDEALGLAETQHGLLVNLTRDPDVLDTWFSSALWPFATLGWPENPPQNGEGDHAKHGGGARADGAASQGPSIPHVPLHRPADGPPPRAGEDFLARHYPNNLLISGFDILFFWDARMMMMGMHCMGEVPWHRLYLHGLVRAPDGQKMSKSKGNVVDPLGLIDKYGADALRFFMAAMESQGRDIKMDESRVEGYRNFATKLWNAARFCQANGIKGSKAFAAPPASAAVNRWIIGEVVECQAAIDKAMADLRFDAAANAIYHFVWDRFCDWYLELIKPVLSPLPLAGGAGGGPETRDQAMPTPNPSRKREGDLAEETREVAGWALDQILVMLHPFMPFVTEELWSKLAHRPNYPLITEKWPEPEASVDSAAKAEIEWLIALTSAMRGARNELGIPPGEKLHAFCEMPSELAAKAVKANMAALERLARLSAIEVAPAPPGAAMQVTAGEDVFVVPLAGVIDIEAEKARLKKALENSRKEAKSLEGRLSNASFIERAKPEAVEKARADHAHHTAEAERLEAALARLG
jgi:valyl-tRNA synthetase